MLSLPYMQEMSICGYFCIYKTNSSLSPAHIEAYLSYIYIYSNKYIYIYNTLYLIPIDYYSIFMCLLSLFSCRFPLGRVGKEQPGGPETLLGAPERERSPLGAPWGPHRGPPSTTAQRFLMDCDGCTVHMYAIRIK